MWRPVQVEPLESRTFPSVNAALFNGILAVTGTAAADDIQITQSEGRILVGGDSPGFPADGVTAITVDGLAGDDRILLGDSLPTNAWLFGGPGDDTLTAGAGDDRLFGGIGDDTLDGRAGSDTLDGGLGIDTIIALDTSDVRSQDGPDEFAANTALEVSIIEQTNYQRGLNGLPPLRSDTRLNAAAELQAVNMVELSALLGRDQVVSHTLPGTLTPTLSTRAQAVGYGSSFVGENLANGITVGPSVVGLWLGSPGHRENLLRPDFDEIGVATRTAPDGSTFYVQVFGQSARAERLPEFAVGSGLGAGPTVELRDLTGRIGLRVEPFAADATGGVRVATGDVTGDGIDDVITATGPGAGNQLAVFDGTDGRELARMSPFESAFTGGVFVAAGDITGDGVADIAVSPDQGGGPRIRVFDGRDFGVIADFFGIDDPAFRGGARVAMGDLDGDARADLFVAAGFGGGPRVAGYDGASLSDGLTRKLFDDFFAFEPTLRNGVHLAAGDLDGDANADLIVGGGPGGGPRVTALSGRELLGDRRTALADFFAGPVEDRGGVRVGAKDLDGDGIDELITGSGRGDGSAFSIYLGDHADDESARPAAVAEAFAGSFGGIFVG